MSKNRDSQNAAIRRILFVSALLLVPFAAQSQSQNLKTQNAIPTFFKEARQNFHEAAVGRP